MNALKIKISSIKNINLALVPVFIVGASLFVVFAVSTSVSAQSERTSKDSIQVIHEYCKRIMPAKAKEGCTLDNAEHARNVATYNVDLKSKTLADDIVEKAQAYMRQARDKRPTGVNDLKKKLDTLLKSKNGKLRTANPKTNEALAAETICPPDGCRDPALDCSVGADKCDLIKKYVNPAITFLAAFVVIAVTIGIISGGIRYTTAGDDPQKIAAARGQIRSAIIALLAFIFLYAAIQWMIPQTGAIFIDPIQKII